MGLLNAACWPLLDCVQVETGTHWLFKGKWVAYCGGINNRQGVCRSPYDVSAERATEQPGTFYNYKEDIEYQKERRQP